MNQPGINKIPVKKFYPGIAWFFLTLILISIPGYDLPDVDEWLIEINFDKFIHVALFGTLSFLFMLPFFRSSFSKKEKQNWFIRIALAVIIWGITTEFIQKFFIPRRSFTLGDWAADGLGGILVLVYFSVRLQKMMK